MRASEKERKTYSQKMGKFESKNSVNIAISYKMDLNAKIRVENNSSEHVIKAVVKTIK